MQGDGKTMHTVESLRRRAGLGMRKGGWASCPCHAKRNPIKGSLLFPPPGQLFPTVFRWFAHFLRVFAQIPLVQRLIPSLSITLSPCPDVWFFLAFLMLQCYVVDLFLSCLLQWKKNLCCQGLCAFWSWMYHSTQNSAWKAGDSAKTGWMNERSVVASPKGLESGTSVCIKNWFRTHCFSGVPGLSMLRASADLLYLALPKIFLTSDWTWLPYLC